MRVRRPLRLAVDVSPLVWHPRRGVARALAHLLAGLADEPDVDAVRVAPRPGENPRAFRRRAADEVRPLAFDAWYAPWSAFPPVEVPVVACVHELPFVRLGPVEGRWRACAHRRWLAHDVRRAAALVVPSAATRDDLLTLHPGAASRLHVVPHGFAPLPAAPPAPATRGPAHDAARPSVLVLGACGPRKAVDVLARALEAPGLACAVVLVGRPDRRTLARLSSAAPTTVHDDPDDAEVARLLAEADVLVYPSRSEGFGFPPLEAMAAGVPVVASAAGSIPEVVGFGADAAADLVPPGDPRALRSALDRVLSDAAHAAALVERGRRRAHAFPPTAAARSLLKIVRAAVERGTT